MLVWGLLSLWTLSSFTSVEPASKKFPVPDAELEKGNKFWYTLGKKELDSALKREQINRVAKNVILFLGDGMGITASTAGRIFKGQKRMQSGEEAFLVWERFPNVALAKTYNLDKQVADSAASATAFLSGVKANYETVGTNGGAARGDCGASLRHENRPSSILTWAQDAGKDTGFVTTTRVTHATPAALYAHSSHRNWECDTKMDMNDPDTRKCKDIARQLVEESPGKNVNVVLGGGRNTMGSLLPGDVAEACSRNDGRNLTKEWIKDKENRSYRAKYVTNKDDFRKLDLVKEDYIMGLFHSDNLPYSYEGKDIPTLSELTEAAIKRLQRNPKGFFLLVEGGRIDHALHDNKPRIAMEEILAFDQAVESALASTATEDTLVIVTADHSHVMTMNGYPDRGNDILGKMSYEHVTDGLPYTTLMFTTGNSTNYTYDGAKVVRSDIAGVDTTDHAFMPQSAVPTEYGYETHGGEDVAIYASGPMAHLFHSLHEQTYVAHVMGYAACIGPYRGDCNRPSQSGARGVGSTGLSEGIFKFVIISLVLANV